MEMLRPFFRLAFVFACALPTLSIAQNVTLNQTGGSGGADIGYGGGKAWAVTTDGSVWRFDNPPGAWTKMPGSNAARISVDSRGNAWVVSTTNKLLEWKGAGWYVHNGDFRDIAIGRTAAGDFAWATGGGTDGSGNFNIYRLEGGRWVEKPGMAARIAVDRFGEPWVVTAQNVIYRWTALGPRPWLEVAGGARDIGAGPEGSVWIVGTDGMIWWWNFTHKKWVAANARLAQIAVDDDGNPWGVDSSGYLVRGEREDKRFVDGNGSLVADETHSVLGKNPVITVVNHPYLLARWMPGPNGSIRHSVLGTCMALIDPAPPQNPQVVLGACDGSPAATGWSFRAGDRTIRNSAYPDGCLYVDVPNSHAYFLKTCNSTDPNRTLRFDLR